MELTRRDKVYLIGAFGAVLITAFVHIGIREWYAPDVRYEEGSYYISGSTAVTSLKLRNHGHSDAEDIKINVKFNKPLVDISIDDRSVRFEPLSGGIGKNHVSGQISSLVPDQEIFIYFAMDNSVTTEELPKRFLSQLTFKGGKGKTGEPILWGLLVAISLTILMLLGTIKIINFSFRKTQKAVEGRVQEYRKYMDFLHSEEYFRLVHQISEMAKQTILNGNPRAIFEESLNGCLKGVEHPNTLRTLGLKYFDSIKDEGRKS